MRTLGLGAAVRHFNEIAVPGMGGVWFCKQLMLSLLGIHVAGNAQATGMAVSNIEVANAIEAVACLSAYQDLNWNRDPRLKGGQKLRGASQPSFSQARKRSFYVSQPMRMSTVEPLLALGFVDGDGERFNAMRLNDKGNRFLSSALDKFAPRNRSVPAHLLAWVRGSEHAVTTYQLTQAISPLSRMPPFSIAILREQIEAYGPGSSRRRAALRWVSSNNVFTDWDTRPEEIDENHWHDLRIGARFFVARDAAIDLLDAVEQEIASAGGKGVPVDSTQRFGRLTELTERLRSKAQAFLREAGDTNLFGDARTFCRECVTDDALVSLSRRDGRILRYRDGAIVPGAAFNYSARSPETPAQAEAVPPETGWPPGISRRIDYLSWMSLDLRGKLDKHIGGKSDEEE
ncbi:hypothetical protein [Rhizobium ruizarguesonis]|uniref:hypothetical protein n=1 Tax=Rhizobium ruizarguesonis TaxID=2081791 RepID=UPI0010305628|nr:hypothetical protein [Rhizobium ruizarguesonis]TAZ88154.1 hypothetical protein ELH67_32120 [Rhizobium ruizarguesonis]TBA29464.1 hypothetical protein ELH60_32230 [Rhizobium ruizarguesonis]TBA73888.1 hypothetical protein ELH56_31530 [Rhizobium ruizarguesonis]TBC54102.1 hypothetical protein ELH36_31770 [Rhizobium ruizarguesonis]